MAVHKGLAMRWDSRLSLPPLLPGSGSCSEASDVANFILISVSLRMHIHRPPGASPACFLVSCLGMQQGAIRYEIWKYYQSTGNVHIELVQNLMVQLSEHACPAWPLQTDCQTLLTPIMAVGQSAGASSSEV